jgi:hypothetical protein
VRNRLKKVTTEECYAIAEKIHQDSNPRVAEALSIALVIAVGPGKADPVCELRTYSERTSKRSARGEPKQIVHKQLVISLTPADFSVGDELW